MTRPPASGVVGSCDRRYARTACLWGEAHDPLAERLAAHLDLDGVRVLDVGCGEGRNAAFFVQRGAAVRAIDYSSLALANGRRRWAHLDVAWEEADVREARFARHAFDVVFACSVLHWLGDESVIAKALRRLRSSTRPGGLHGLVVFNDRRPYEAPTGESLVPRLLPHAWYLARYADWRILYASDTDTSESHRGHWEQHSHAVTRLIAARPGGPSAR